ncbi:MAG: DUF2341 domain-containing protein [Lentisphaerae bacterium]|nr:DUF2341 domain-containing protein [Lentisphaerota bacterium]
MKVRMLHACAMGWLLLVGVANAAVTIGSDSYTYSTQIPINYAEPNQLDNFPVLVVLTPANFNYALVRESAGIPQDLRFTVSDVSGTELPYEIDGVWNNTGTTRIWVKVPTILASTATQIYAVYGNATVSAPSYGASVWDNNFMLVYHFAEGAGTAAANAKTDVPNIAASAFHPYNAQWVGSASWVDAVIGKGVYFNGSVANFLDTRAYPVDLANNGLASRTTEMWVKFDGPDASVNRGVFSMGNAQNVGGLSLEWSVKRLTSGEAPPSGFLAQCWGNERRASDTTPSANGNWAHFALSYDSANSPNKPQLYINGVENSFSVSGTPANLNTTPPTGTFAQYGKLFLGTRRDEWYANDAGGVNYGVLFTAMLGAMDEVRISGNMQRSPGWLRATYQTVADPTFSPTKPMIEHVSDSGAGATSRDLVATLNWPATADSTVRIHWGTANAGVGGAWEHTDTLSSQAAGTINATIGPLSINTPYYYWLSAENGSYECWAPSVGSFTTPAGTANVTIGASDASATEGTPATDTGTFTITRDLTIGVLTVNYTLTGAAVEGSDYATIATHSVSFADGEATKDITITPINDIAFEGPEAVTCAIAGGSGYVSGSPASADVTIASDDASALSGFRYRMPITVAGYTGGETLNNFPVLVKLSAGIDGFSYSQFASVTGGDLRFMDASQTTRLSYEIEKWDTAGTSYVWVKVPELSAATVIYAYWGNPADAAAPSYATDGSAWNSAYGRVYHLNSIAAGDLTDSCKSGNDLTAFGTPQNDTDPVHVGAVQTTSDGLDYFQAAGTGIEYAGQTAVEFWYRYDGAVSAVNRTPIAMRDGTSTRWSLHVATENTLVRYGVFNGGWTWTDNGRGKSLERWYHVTAIDSGVVGGTTTFYVDGQYVNGQLGAIVAAGFAKVTGKPLVLGMRAPGDAAEYFIGALDEVRISSSATSADWVLANYKTQSSDTFLTFGTIENLLVDTGATGLVGGGNVTLNATITDVSAWPVQAYVAWGAADQGSAYLSWDNYIDLGSKAGPGPVTLSQSVAVPGGVTYYRFILVNPYTTITTPLGSFAGATVSIAALDGTASEDSNPGSFQITRSVITTGPLTVRYTLGGGAVNGTDYETLSGSVTFADGETTKTVTVTPVADNTIDEGSETVTATLVHGGFVLGTASANVSIADGVGDVSSGWSKSAEITFSGYTGSSTLNNFPVLVRLSAAGVGGFAYSAFGDPLNGGDLRFTDEAGTQWLPHEIDRWNSSGESFVWVKLPALSGTATKIRAVWGNAGQTIPPDYTTDGSVWSEGYAAVYHCKDAADGDMTDSSPNAKYFDNPHGANRVNGKVGYARLIENDNTPPQTFITSPWTADALGIGQRGHPWTVEAMGYNTVAPGDTYWKEGSLTWIGHNDETLSETKFAVRQIAASAWREQIGLSWSRAPDAIWSPDNSGFTPVGVPDLQADTWYYVTGVYDGMTTANGGRKRLYIDGILDEQTAADTAEEIFNNVPLCMGYWLNNVGNYAIMNGMVDEVRISTVARSADWIKASADAVQNASFAEYPPQPPVTIMMFK